MLPRPVNPFSLAPQGTASIFSSIPRAGCFFFLAPIAGSASSKIPRRTQHFVLMMPPCSNTFAQAKSVGEAVSTSPTRLERLLLGLRSGLARLLARHHAAIGFHAALLLGRLDDLLWMLLELFLQLRMRLQVGLQLWMTLNVFLVLRQRRILRELLGDPRMVAEECAKAG